MPSPEPATRRLNALYPLCVVAGAVLVLAGLVLDASRLLALAGLAPDQLRNTWVRQEFVTARVWCIVTGSLLALAGGLLWRFPAASIRAADALRNATLSAEQRPSIVVVALALLVLAKTVIQFLLYRNGYVAYGADDFARTLSADYWLHHGGGSGDSWLGFAGSVWLPLPDVVFGLGLAIHRDLFFTPKIENLVFSAVIVVAAYFLGRTLFGRVAGLITAALAAFQPWLVWLGISGMTSDLPSILLIVVFAAYMFRWFETDQPRALLTAAGSLGLAHGFRHESWCFTAVFSILLVLIVMSRWRKKRLTPQWLALVASALLIMNAFPVVWMAKTYFGQGAIMPHFSWSQWSSQPSTGSVPGPEMSSSEISYMGIPLLAGGSFPFEILLSLAGIIFLLRRNARRSHRLYVTVLAAAALSFTAAFKGQIAASIVFARYLVPFVIVALPYAGGLFSRLLASSHERRPMAIGALVVLLGTLTFDVSRAFNYPDQFPTDAISAGWTIRKLQDTGAISPAGKVLIERAEDWGDMGVVALANRPERFVVLNELAYRQTALWRKSANRPAPIPRRIEDGVRGTVCERDFQAEPCRTSVIREGFDLAVLSSPARADSFGKAFGARSRVVGRYHIFDLKADASRASPDRR